MPRRPASRSQGPLRPRPYDLIPMISWLTGLWSDGQAVVETAGPRDTAALAQIHGASFHRGWGEDEFERMLSERNTLVHRLRLGRKIIGFSVSRMAADEAEILSIAVAGTHRGRGLSNTLLLTHLGHLAGRGIRTVFLEVEENNQPARRLYQRAGFSVVGRRERYYQQGGGEALNALMMRRDLS
jgi:[ribosomal protein S18]-alanine N-acetyltransferase